MVRKFRFADSKTGQCGDQIRAEENIANRGAKKLTSLKMDLRFKT